MNDLLNSDNVLFLMFIGMLLASVISISAGRGSKADPLDRPSRPPRETSTDQTPLLNMIASDPVESDRYVRYIATNGAPNSLTDEMVEQSVRDIMNNRSLSASAQLLALDALKQRTWNDHPRGVAADVVEVINEAELQIMYPGRQ